MMTKSLTAGLVQLAYKGSAEANLAACVDGIRQAAAQGAKLVLLQALHNGPYPCQCEEPARFDLAEPIPGNTTVALSALAQELGVVIVASLFERRTTGLYHQTAVVLDADGQQAGLYRKMHIPNHPGAREKFYFTPGDLGFKPVDTAVGRLGVLMDWDQWFPEAARLMALAGAEILLYPTAMGWNPADDEGEQERQLDAWITVQRSHAITNGLPLMTCNRTGIEEDEASPDGARLFWGSSFVCGAQGEILAEAPSDEDSVLLVTLDLARSEQVRRVWPFLRDRRVEAYSELYRRFIDASVAGIAADDHEESPIRVMESRSSAGPSVAEDLDEGHEEDDEEAEISQAPPEGSPRHRERPRLSLQQQQHPEPEQQSRPERPERPPFRPREDRFNRDSRPPRDNRYGGGGYGGPPRGDQNRDDRPPRESHYSHGGPPREDRFNRDDRPPPRENRYGGGGGYGGPPRGGDRFNRDDRSGTGGPPRQGGYGGPPRQGGYGGPPREGGYGGPPRQGGYGGPPRGDRDGPPRSEPGGPPRQGGPGGGRPGGFHKGPRKPREG